jgi:serine/threonine protein kinase
MTPEWWQRVSQVYEAVLERPSEEREHFLAEHCAGDAALRAEIESLLAQDDCRSPLDQPVWESEELAAGASASDYNAAFPQSQHMLLGTGARLGPYEIHSAIGAGGMGEVYRGVDTRLNRPVAVKILKPDVAADPVFRARFDREARTISHLDHPNICTLYDVGQDGSTAFIVMQYLEGVPLSEQSRLGALGVDDVVRIGISLASALAYAHGRGILHRDVKPQNVIVMADGRVKLLDFGIAKSHCADPDDVTIETPDALTRFDQAPGTLAYMAPEQLSGLEADGRSDIFSLGVVLYELAFGRHPFRAQTAALTAFAVLEAKYPSVPGASGSAANLDRVLRKMLAAAPNDRYPTMADCLADLQRIGPHTATEDAPTAETRSGRVYLVAAAIVLAVVIGGFIVWPATTGTTPSSATADPTTSPAATTRVNRITYWLDVESPSGTSSAPRAFQSLGDDTYGSGWRFRINVLSATPRYVYVVGDETSSATNPSGVTVLFAAPNQESAADMPVTTGWFVFTGPPARERLWLIWSAAPLAELAALEPLINERDRGVVRDPDAAARLRELLRTGSERPPTVNADRAANRATIETPDGLVVHRLELQHD